MIQAYIPYKVIESHGGFDSDGKPSVAAMPYAIAYALQTGQIDESEISTSCILCSKEANLTGMCVHEKDADVSVLGTKTVKDTLLLICYQVCQDCRTKYSEIESKLRSIATN